MTPHRAPEHPIIFFDGVCGMCNKFVNVIQRADRKRVFRFAPLQGQTAKELLLPLSENPQEWSVLYLDETGLYDQSDASLQICRKLGGLWWVLSLLRFIPRAVRTPVYRFIATHRYRWFGRKDACRIPTLQERAMFLP